MNQKGTYTDAYKCCTNTHTPGGVFECPRRVMHALGCLVTWAGWRFFPCTSSKTHLSLASRTCWIGCFLRGTLVACGEAKRDAEAENVQSLKMARARARPQKAGRNFVTARWFGHPIYLFSAKPTAPFPLLRALRPGKLLHRRAGKRVPSSLVGGGKPLPPLLRADPASPAPPMGVINLKPLGLVAATSQIA